MVQIQTRQNKTSKSKKRTENKRQTNQSIDPFFFYLSSQIYMLTAHWSQVVLTSHQSRVTSQIKSTTRETQNTHIYIYYVYMHMGYTLYS